MLQKFPPNNRFRLVFLYCIGLFFFSFQSVTSTLEIPHRHTATRSMKCIYTRKALDLRRLYTPTQLVLSTSIYIHTRTLPRDNIYEFLFLKGCTCKTRRNRDVNFVFVNTIPGVDEAESFTRCYLTNNTTTRTCLCVKRFA